MISNNDKEIAINTSSQNGENKVTTDSNQNLQKKQDLTKNDSLKTPVKNSQRTKKFNKVISEFEERVIQISRVTNVVKGGRRFSFSVLVVVGNKKGQVGYGQGKAKEIPEAIKKAIRSAKKRLINVPIVDGRTISHVTSAKFVSSKVLLKPVPKGSGIIASGTIRQVVELAGYNDIITKSLRSSNKKNVVKATIKALTALRTKEQIMSLRK